MLSVKFEQAFFFLQASEGKCEILFLTPSTVMCVSRSKIACSHRRISCRRICLPSFTWNMGNKKNLFCRLDKTHCRIRLPIRSCSPVRAGYVDTQLFLLSAFLPSVAFGTTNTHTLSFICCLNCISMWIHGYLKEKY